MSNNNVDIELLAGLSIESSEQEILRAIKIIQKRLKANHDARFKLNVDIDETVIRNTVDKLQNILKGKELSIDTKDSIQALSKEVNAMADIVTVAKKASVEKLEFAEANKKVKVSADDTVEAINRERNAMSSLDDVDSILTNINMHGQQGNSVFQQFGDTFRDAFGAYSLANLMERALDGVVDAGKEAIETVKQFDDINVDLQMATGADKEYVKGLISDYAELGGELGALTQTVAESADTFLRQGRSMEETNQLIEDAVVLSKVAQTNGEKASEILTATINGFQLAATEGSRVNDIISSIDMNSAVSAEGIGTALTKVASMANSAGLSLEKTAAIAAVLKQTTMDADQTIGTSMKTMLSRMNQIRAGKFVDEETGEALNDVEKVLNKIGISMRNEVNGQFKEAEVIIDEIGRKWATFDENSKKAAQFALGGAYQANKVVALFDNYDKVIELTKIAEESAGVSLQKFNDSYLPSLEAKINALKSSLDALATTTISDELYASILDTAKAIVDTTTETGMLKSTLIGLGAGGSLYAVTQLANFIRDSAQGLSNYSAALDMVKTGNITTATSMQRLVDLTQGLSNSQLRLLLSTNNLTDSQKIAIMVANGTEQELAEQQLQTWGLINAQNGATASTVTLGTAMKGLTATMLANPIFLVTTAITLGVTAFNLYQSAVEKAEQRLSDLREELLETTSELESVESELKNINSQIDEILSKDTITLTDENDLKRLQLENEELERRKKLLELQQQADSKELNEAAEDEYKKKFQTKRVSVWIPEDERVNVVNPNQTRATKSVTQEEKFAYNLKLAKELASYEGKITEEQAKQYEELQTYFLEQADSLSDIKDGYNAITPEQQEQLRIWNQMIDDAIWVSENFPGSAKNVTSRLMDKFAGGFNRNDGSTYLSTTDADKQIGYWIESLSDDEKKILLGCELEDASLDELRQYLKDSIKEIEKESTISISDVFAYEDEKGESTPLSDYKNQLLEVENAYQTCLSAKEEYDKQGYLSVETLEKVLALGDDYLQYLFDEQGNVKLDAEAFKQLSLARINDMEAQALNNLAQNIKQISDEASATKYLAEKQNELANSYGDVAVNALIAMKSISGFSDSEALQSAYDSFKAQYEQIKGLFAATRKGLDKGFSGGSEDIETNAKSHIESYMEYQQKSLEKGEINYNTYSNEVSAFLKKMFDEGKISAQEYFDYTSQMLEKQKEVKLCLAS